MTIEVYDASFCLGPKKYPFEVPISKVRFCAHRGLNNPPYLLAGFVPHQIDLFSVKMVGQRPTNNRNLNDIGPKRRDAVTLRIANTWVGDTA